MRAKLTWLIVAAVAAVVVFGVVDAVRGSSTDPEAAQAGGVVIGPSATPTVSAQSTTEPVTTTEPVGATESADGGATTPEPKVLEHLPSCEPEQLRLGFTLSMGLAALVLARGEGPPCHHRAAPVGVTVRDEAGNRVTVFGGNAHPVPAADFIGDFVQEIDLPQMSCDPQGSFVVVVRVGRYVIRNTYAGSDLPCNHG